MTTSCVSSSKFTGRGFSTVTKTGGAWVVDSGDDLRKFADYSAFYGVGIGSVNYAATDGFLIVAAVGSYMNGLEVWVGNDASTPWLFSLIGDDMNYNSKAWTVTLPIRQGMYYKIVNGSSRIGFGYGFESFYTLAFVPWQ